MQNRAWLRLTRLTLLTLAACAGASRAPTTPAAQPFASDRISVEVRGSGPDVILVPGLAAHRDTWSTLADTLADRYRLHLVQLAGFAGVPAGPNGEGPVAAPVAEELARYIQAAALTRPAIVGHSMGGTIGMMVAARHPELVGRLMVIDQVPFVGVLFDPNATPESARPMADQFRNALLADTERKLLVGIVESMTLNETMKPVLVQYARDSDLRTIANAMHEMFVTDLRPELAKITAQMTVVYTQAPNVFMR
jgi:pimeloyl-ACP methyl ester carboxylesterase